MQLTQCGNPGVVEGVEVRREKHPGLDDVHLVRISGCETHLDAGTASLIRVGDEIRKPAWSATLTTPQGTSSIRLSRDFRRMTVAMPLVTLLVLFLLRRPGRKDARAPAGVSEPEHGPSR